LIQFLALSFVSNPEVQILVFPSEELDQTTVLVVQRFDQTVSRFLRLERYDRFHPIKEISFWCNRLWIFVPPSIVDLLEGKKDQHRACEEGQAHDPKVHRKWISEVKQGKELCPHK
jgi:hypothetical protein